MSLRLTIELVPSTAWGKNLRDMLTRQQWDTLRRLTYKHYGYRCAICQASDTALYCHEQWEYDDTTHIQKLVGLIALCKWCHHCKHMGHAGILASRGELDLEQVIQHFLQVNSCSRDDYETHSEQVWATWKERCKYEWTLDIGKYARLAQSTESPAHGYKLSNRKKNYIAECKVFARVVALGPRSLRRIPLHDL